MLLIAGLGNPGAKYHNTRHNIGFIITGALAEKHDIKGTFSSKFNATVGKGDINNTEVLIVQPQTFMNLSGEAISKVLHWYKADITALLVIYDDISLDFGKIRFRPSGSAGSHNGIKSIIQHCGGQDFPRLKVGIGPNPGGHALSSFVLEPFTKSEQESLPKITAASIEAVEFYLKEGMTAARNRFNGANTLE